VTPDLACFGKAMANGMPLSAIAGKRELMQELNHAFFSMTAGGECLSLAASKCTLDILGQSDYEGHIWRLGGRLEDGMRKLLSEFKLDGTFAGSAPRHVLSFNPATYPDAAGMKDLFYQEMIKRGVLFGNVVYVTFAHTDLDIDVTLAAAREAMATVANCHMCVDSVLQGKRSVSVFRKNT
jgi:glutamate-1-semialdehyde aminotransferase